MSRVVVLSTGGTIASRIDHARGHVAPAASGADLLAVMLDRGLAPPAGIDLAVEEFTNIGSFAIDLPLAFELARRINERLADPDCHGVVVTHGTDTMEESAYMADLLLASDKPVVFTGAQRNADQPDADGPRNIADAVRLAAAPEAVGLGAMICFEQEFHAARDVTKSHSSRVDTFVSWEHGKLGEIDGDRVVVHRRPVLRRRYEAESVSADIELVKLVMGSTGRYISFAADQGSTAIVLECFGRGNATPDVAEAVAAVVVAGIPVVVTSRCARGRVKPIYGNGGGKTLEDAGAFFAGDLAARRPAS